jgi:hypothetical protein
MRLRPTLLFFTAYAINTSAHEAAHALAAYFLGIRSTLFHFYVTPYFTNDDPTPRVLIAVAGPLFSLAFGLVCWLIYGKKRLPCLYLAILAISIFLGNLFSTSFAGDFGTAATILNVAPAIRLVMTIAALILVCAFLYAMGRELAKWAPPGASRMVATVQMTVLPAVLGTALVILAFLPLPGQFIIGWIGTSCFWVFTAAGAFFVSTHRFAGGDLRIRPFDIVAAVAVLVVVRILANGILLN